MNLLQGFKRERAKVPKGMKRSDQWPKVRKEHLINYPQCEVCGGLKDIEVHHIKPFHLHPSLELDPDNLITLCEANKGGFDCHLGFGHLGNFKSYNVSVIEDAKVWNKKIHSRP